MRRESRASHLISNSWFLIGIIFCAVLAQVYPQIGRVGGALKPEWSVNVAVGFIYLLSGFSLRIDEVAKAIKNHKINLFIQGYTFIFTPVVVLIFNETSSYFFHVNDWILKGIETVSCMPPSLSSAIIITKSVGGNEAISVYNSVLGNFIGAIISPVMLYILSGSTAIVSTLNTLIILLQTSLLPLGIGLFIRRCNIFRNSFTYLWNNIGQGLLLFIVFTTFCEAFETHNAPVNASDILIFILLVMVIQLLLLNVSYHSSQRLKLTSAPDSIAITFCSTHKSLTLGILILRTLYAGYSHFHQIALPLLIYHPIQIILGGLITIYLKKNMPSNQLK